ncbi:hypothetical protein Patl1_33904 [Pistacia atlantica]|uniref:Uncharacterized protein n=1 Tax=Pistacia atlantica TaxID=434234 RepID=A0ACC0ZSB2_9ROSI|nr:hypothetical protein Patl1_33904 [Pistacia atlantica]
MFLVRFNLDRLLARTWDEMGVVRVYTKPQGQQPDFSEPVVLSVDRGGCTVEEMPAYDTSTHIEHGRKKVNPDGSVPIWEVQCKRKAAYVAVMRNATTTDRRGFESLPKFYKKVYAVQEKELILQAIACSPDPDMVAKVLNFLVSDEVFLFSNFAAMKRLMEVQSFFRNHVNPGIDKILM